MRYRPYFHFAPRAHWMNDPNGCVKIGEEFHLFFQYHPHSLVWGPMHWGHAVSRDLLTWEERETALFPDSQGQVFSGTALLDRNNDSGLFDDDKGLLLFYTSHLEREGDRALQRQCLAFSKDGGRTFDKYPGNPIIQNPGLPDYRDPKVLFHRGAGRWVMLLAAGDHLEILNSTNLIDWERTGDIVLPPAGRKTLWECPDLELLMILDGSVLELLLDGGLQVLTYRIFPGEELTRLEISRPDKSEGTINIINREEGA